MASREPGSEHPPGSGFDATIDAVPLPASGDKTIDPSDSAYAATLAPNDTARTSPTGPLPDEVPGYEILQEIGRGGMGVVYLARQRALQRLVALKMILAGEYASAEACVRFLSEAESIAKLHHPNIVQIYELGRHRNVPFFSLEYLEGGSLDRRIDGRPRPALEAARTIETLAAGIQAAPTRA